jgi:glycine cleavage system H protein
MTVALVVLMFAVILLVDHLVNRNKTVETPVSVPVDRPARLLPSFVGGFRLADNVRYHLGHTWALSESPKLVRVGLDDFAARLVGKFDSVVFPTAGQWVRQGQKVFSFVRDGKEVSLVSPVEGAVVEVNPALAADPQLALNDPYGDGWLVTVDAPDAKTSFRNLLGGMLARRWMEDAAARLRAMMPTPVAAVAQDGGTVVDDVASQMTPEEWEKAAHEFFLT